MSDKKIKEAAKKSWLSKLGIKSREEKVEEMRKRRASGEKQDGSKLRTGGLAPKGN